MLADYQRAKRWLDQKGGMLDGAFLAGRTDVGRRTDESLR
jgi:hypothetical protein